MVAFEIMVEYASVALAIIFTVAFICGLIWNITANDYPDVEQMTKKVTNMAGATSCITLSPMQTRKLLITPPESKRLIEEPESTPSSKKQKTPAKKIQAGEAKKGVDAKKEPAAPAIKPASPRGQTSAEKDLRHVSFKPSTEQQASKKQAASAAPSELRQRSKNGGKENKQQQQQAKNNRSAVKDSDMQSDCDLSKWAINQHQAASKIALKQK